MAVLLGFFNQYKNGISGKLLKILALNTWGMPENLGSKYRAVGKYVMRDVRQLAIAKCDGRVLPTFCSGLSVVSRFPLDQISFTSYSVHGDFWMIDGEYWARKGIGRVRIEPHMNFTVVVFLTHTCAEDYNSWYRERRVKISLRITRP